MQRESASQTMRQPHTPTIEAVRAFNLFYTRKLGLLQRGLLASSYSLTEVRVLYELAHLKDLTATDLTSSLGIDRGYLSRILRAFEKDRLMARKRSTGDARRSLLRLTARGRAIFSRLDDRQSDEVSRMLDGISIPAQESLIASMRTVQQVLDADAGARGEVRLRAHRPGDMGW